MSKTGSELNSNRRVIRIFCWSNLHHSLSSRSLSVGAIPLHVR